MDGHAVLLQAAYSLCNIACQSEEMSTVLLNKGALQVAVPLLKNHDHDTVELALNFCHLMLTNDKKVVVPIGYRGNSGS